MANLQALRKRLKSINSTGETAKAMKTVATVKYSKTGKTLSDFKAYSEAFKDVLEIIGNRGFIRECETTSSRNCYVLLSSNRGFCGGFNSELFREFVVELEEESEDPIIIAFGKKAQRFCQENNIAAEYRDINDVPQYAEAEEITNELLKMYCGGEVDRVYIVSQHFVNMMTQKPEKKQLLPLELIDAEKKVETNYLLLPDSETVGNTPAIYALTGMVYEIMLSHAAALHAASLIAMRNACDNAEESSSKLELMINRIRQMSITNSVIETSSGMAMQYMEK